MSHCFLGGPNIREGVKDSTFLSNYRKKGKGEISFALRAWRIRKRIHLLPKIFYQWGKLERKRRTQFNANRARKLKGGVMRFHHQPQNRFQEFGRAGVYEAAQKDLKYHRKKETGFPGGGGLEPGKAGYKRLTGAIIGQ